MPLTKKVFTKKSPKSIFAKPKLNFIDLPATATSLDLFSSSLLELQKTSLLYLCL